MDPDAFECKFSFLLVVSALLSVASASDVFLIRGIPLERAALYDPAKDFACLDGTTTVPFSFVNDDYCDCSDGSDEPGTAACPNSTFFCPNVGYSPLVIPSSRVNDGICDCCDASDEYQPGSNCVNTCASLGEVAREEHLRLMREQEVGYKARQELVSQANSKRSELEAKKTELKAIQDKAREEVAEKERIKKQIEERENAALAVHREREEAARAKKAEEERLAREAEMKAVWDVLDIDKDGVLSLTEIQVDTRFDQNRDGVVSPEEARFFTLNQDSIGWEDFSRTGWVLMKPYIVGESPMFTPPEEEPEIEEPLPPAEHEPVPEPEPEPEPVESAEEPEKSTDSEASEEHDENFDDYTDEYHDSTLPPPSPEKPHHDEGYDEETMLLIDEADKARKEYNEADRTLRDLEHELNSIEATLEKDFGPEDAFLPLEGQCLEYNDREYTYKLCFFGQATQKPRHGGGETKLGSWKSWAGSKTNPYEKMLFENGLGCWNGPNRSAQVQLSCGKESKILSVSEPSRCLYYFEVETPAVCIHPPTIPEHLAAAHHQWHEEL